MWVKMRSISSGGSGLGHVDGTVVHVECGAGDGQLAVDADRASPFEEDGLIGKDVVRHVVEVVEVEQLWIDEARRAADGTTMRAPIASA